MASGMSLTKRYALYLLIPLLGLISYVYTFKIGFVWDDYLYIQQQLASIKDFNFFEGLKKFTYFRPTVTIFSLVDYNIWHRNPLGYHITNFCFHLINSLLVALLTYRLLSKEKLENLHEISAVAGILFVLHPVHTESVNWIEGRTDLICTTFFLLSIISYVVARQEKNPRAFLPFLVFALFSFGAKEPAVMLPVVVMAYEFIYSENRRTLVVVLIISAISLVTILVLRSNVFQGLVASFKEIDKLEVLKLFIISYGFYLKKIFYPPPLNFFIGEIPDNLVYFVLSAISIALMVGFVLFLKGRAPLVSFSILWWLVTIAPHGVILLGTSAVTPVAERYIYLPSVGFSSAISYLIFTRLNRKALRWAVVGAFVVFFGVLTFKRTFLWTDNEALWKDTVEKSPKFSTPYLWYGNALFEKGKFSEALEVWKKALECPYMVGKDLDKKGDDARFRRNLLYTSIALAYIQLGDYEKAVENLKKAIELFTHYHSYYLLGMIERERASQTEEDSTKKRHLENALRLLKTSAQLNPSHQESLFYLALTEKELGLYLDAMEHFKMSFELDPRTSIGIQSAFYYEEVKTKAYTPVK